MLPGFSWRVTGGKRLPTRASYRRRAREEFSPLLRRRFSFSLLRLPFLAPGHPATCSVSPPSPIGKNSVTTDADVLAAVDVQVYPDGQAVLLESVFGNSLTYDSSTGRVISAQVFMQVLRFR